MKTRDPSARRTHLHALALAALCGALPARGAHPPVAALGSHAASNLWEAVNGAVEKTGDGTNALWRWRPNEGQTAELRLRPENPLADSLRYYDRLQFRFRVAAGRIDAIGLRALGHVSGGRQYRPHQWNIAFAGTPTNVWHDRDLDLTRPNWLPWDNPDGEGRAGYFLVDAVATAPETLIEIADARLVRSAVLVKPFYEFPITWPLKTTNADGSAVYRLSVQALNASGAPATLSARLASAHTRFRVTLETNDVAAKANQVVDFPMSAVLGREDIAATPELYSERLRVLFTASSCPEAEASFETPLVRPLSPGLCRQVIVPAADLQAIREKIGAGDAELRKRLGYDAAMRGADAFLEKRFLQIPPGHQWPGSNPGPGWMVSDTMPGITNRATGEQEYGTSLAGLVWKRYLTYPGFAAEHAGLAYLFTGDEKYAQKAIELFRLYARQYRELPWNRAIELPWLAGPSLETSSRMASSSSYGSNIFMKHHMRLLSMIAPSPSWTPEEFSSVYTNFSVPYAAELAKAYSGIQNQTDISNHNLTLLGLVFDDALMLHQAVLSDAGLLARISDIDAEGFSSEGRPLGYHFAGMAEYLPAVEYLANAGLTLPFDTGRLLAAMRMPYRRATLTGRAPNAGDCARGNRAGPQPLAGHLTSLFPNERWLLDIGADGTLTSKTRSCLAGLTFDPEAWRPLLETAPTLFREAGFAILRSGTQALDQVMVTLDYGRAYYHVGLNRNQIALAAFGALLTHDPGSLYNVGHGGMTRTTDARLDSFSGHHTIGFNVIAVDTQDQSRAIGKLLAWSPKPDFQVAVSRIEGAYPGVRHTRGLVLTDGLVIVLDRLEADRERTFDFAYHNHGELSLGEGWTATPAAAPLGATANYESIQDLRRLEGGGPIRLTWDLAEQFPTNDPARAQGVALDLWQLPVEGGEVYSGVTGLNNPNRAIYPDRAPSLFHRVRAAHADFATVLEPRKGSARVEGIGSAADGGLDVRLRDGRRFAVSLSVLIQESGAGVGR